MEIASFSSSKVGTFLNWTVQGKKSKRKAESILPSSLVKKLGHLEMSSPLPNPPFGSMSFADVNIIPST